jgi:hypothetical protein
MSIRELRECFADPSHRVQPSIIALQSLSGHKLTKSSIESLLGGVPPPKPLPQPARISRERSAEELSFEAK